MLNNLSLFLSEYMIRKNGKIIQLDGNTLPSTVPRRWKKMIKHNFRLIEALAKDVEITVGESRYRFRCENWVEFNRCMTMFIKEPGTCEWIRKVVDPGSVFYDIGANIGIYSVLAAERVGESGKVFAFEPNAANFSRLLDNIAANKLQHIVVPCDFALHDENGFFPFRYMSREVGTSNSLLCYLAKDEIQENQGDVSQIKNAVSIDYLISSGSFVPPDHVKIDVDGNKFPILRGMSHLLDSSSRPKSIQVEVATGEREAILSFMARHNYTLATEHYGIYAMDLIARGQNPENYVSNAIFQHEN